MTGLWGPTDGPVDRPALARPLKRARARGIAAGAIASWPTGFMTGLVICGGGDYGLLAASLAVLAAVSVLIPWGMARG